MSSTFFDRIEVYNDMYQSGVRLIAPEIETDGLSPSIPLKQGYLRIPPSDQFNDLRTEISMVLQEMGIPVKYHHHEVGAPGTMRDRGRAQSVAHRRRPRHDDQIAWSRTWLAGMANWRPSCPSRSSARRAMGCTFTRN